MTKKGYLGITALIVFVIAVGGFIYWQLASVEQLKEQADQDETPLEETHKPEQPSVTNKPPRKARDGFEWEWHGDHWHEMPIAQTPQQTPQVQPPTPPEYTGPLTFHKELLETHPVEALYQQTLERGHWSAKHIPPFPPDDQEAAALARNIYLLRYYRSIGQTDTPEFRKLHREGSPMLENILNIEDDARRKDLIRMLWGYMDEINVPWQRHIHKTHFKPPFRRVVANR